jgi:hypothetical protein
MLFPSSGLFAGIPDGINCTATKISTSTAKTMENRIFMINLILIYGES